MVLLSQGIPFIHAGQEFYRTKGGHENSYNAPVRINQLDRYPTQFVRLKKQQWEKMKDHWENGDTHEEALSAMEEADYDLVQEGTRDAEAEGIRVKHFESARYQFRLIIRRTAFIAAINIVMAVVVLAIYWLLVKFLNPASGFQSIFIVAEYFLICRSGNRSGNVAHYLQDQGYKVVNMEGGMLDWSGKTEPKK